MTYLNVFFLPWLKCIHCSSVSITTLISPSSWLDMSFSTLLHLFWLHLCSVANIFLPFSIEWLINRHSLWSLSHVASCVYLSLVPLCLTDIWAQQTWRLPPSGWERAWAPQCSLCWASPCTECCWNHGDAWAQISLQASSHVHWCSDYSFNL